ncbi:uncharacterized protein VP01_2560g3 [Puccinia sorghi]|uniref:No apical meristem-associated C-terminal domain-containing protein n=1 Tax=Puccinia sorghi TaxID=27349 RepID=A0A0L6V524_9BASI|nr:uncharacterized protein VP01_2560g3 [Puccinia sorghi]
MSKAVLQFTAIYNQMKNNLASGLAPTNWLINVKKAHFDSKGKQFQYEGAWNLLKTAAKLQLMYQGNASNGHRASTTPNQATPDGIPETPRTPTIKGHHSDASYSGSDLVGLKKKKEN